MTAWLMMTTEDPVLLGAGYDDDAARYYSWDNTVPLHASPSVGDSIVLWDKNFLLGASVIDEVATGSGQKKRYRCPFCRKTKMQTRKKKKPPYWCPECKQGVTDPIEELIEVNTYRSNHESSWIDLGGKLDGGELRSLCYKPKSQHAIRELDWSRFLLALGEDLQHPVARIASSSSKQIPGGHKPRLVKVRRGQAAFRQRLLRMYGETCALSGSAPSDVLDAAHLYSFAKVGEHDDLGGLLIRKDLHRLFDLGFIAVEPQSLKINVHESLSSYPIYQSLDETRIAVEVDPKTKRWIKRHWELWRASSGRVQKDTAIERVGYRCWEWSQQAEWIRSSEEEDSSEDRFIQVDAGDLFSIGLRADGTAIAWGKNDDGQCNVPAGETFEQVAAGSNHTIGLREDGTAIAWGNNDCGQCDVPAGETFASVSADGAYNIGLREDGTAIAWGANYFGVYDVPSGEAFASVSAGGAHSIGLRKDGTAIAWGRNEDGECDVPSGEQFRNIYAGSQLSFGIRVDGTLIVWGCSDFIELLIHEYYRHEYESPLPWTLASNIHDVAVGRGHVVALWDDGHAGAWCWDGSGFRPEEGHQPLEGQCYYDDDGICSIPFPGPLVQVAAGVSHTIGLVRNCDE